MAIKTIAHCADIHIRKLHRFVEYREVFNRFYEQLKELQPDLIYIGGDVVHGKLDTSPEETRLVADFFLELSSIAKTIIIPGNHDTNLNNKSREDVLSPIVDLVKQINPNIEYWKKSGVYTIDDIDFGFLSIFDTDNDGLQSKVNLPSPDKMSANTKVALFHGTVGTFEVDNGLLMSDERIRVKDFSGYDFVMLGDIHKRQSLNDDQTVIYPGSLIQQNFSEDPSHGFILWDVEKRIPEYHQVKNDYGFKTIMVQDGVIQNTMSYVPKKGRVRIRYSNTSTEQIKDIKLSLHKQYPHIKSIKAEKLDLQPTKDTKKRIDIGDVRDVSYQNQLLKSHLDSYNINDDQLNRIYDINTFTNNSTQIVKADVVRNINWKLKSIKFDNMFSYGENNIVNFEKLEGTVGLVAPNHAGKSALIDAFAYSIFDVCSRTSRALDILNKRKKTFSITTNIEVDEVDYFIERIGKYRKRVSKKYNTITELCPVTVKFYMQDGDEYVDLTGAARKNTQYGSGTNENIRNLLGSFDDFILTTMSLQSNGTDFIEKRQSERKQILSQFLDIGIFDQLYDIARKDIQDDKVLLKRLQDTDLYSSLVNLDTKLEDVNQELKKLKSKESELSKNIETFNREKIKKIKTLHNIEDGLEDSTMLEQKLQTSRSELLEVDEELKNDLEYKETLRPLYNRYNDKLSVIDENQLTNELANLNKLNKKLQKVSSQKGVLEHKRKALEDNLQTLESYKYDPDCEYCITNGKVQITQTKNVRDNIQQTQIELNNVNNELDTYKDVETKLKTYEQKNNQYNQLLEEINQIRQDSFKLASRITDKQSKVKLLETAITNTNTLIDQYNKNSKKIAHNRLVNDEIKTLEQSILDASDNLTTQQKLTADQLKQKHALEVEKSHVDKDIKTMIDLEQKVNDYELYMKSISRDGIPYELVSTTITAVEQEINDVLDNMMVGFTIKLEMDDGKNIMAKIQYDEESWPLELCSGMEKFVSSLAIRVGLINISTLPRPNFIIVDEGFGTLDSDNIGNMKGAFEYLKTQFDFVLIVTHLDTIKDYMDYLIPIEVANGYSKVHLS